MLAKLTSGNQLTLLESITRAVGEASYFEVEVHKEQIILTPIEIHRADAAREKLAVHSISEQDATDAVNWARKS